MSIINEMQELLEKKAKTWAQALGDIMDKLESEGWTLSGNLKIPHATSKDGKYRLWFKKQAIHFTVGNQSRPGAKPTHSFKDARALNDLDYRKIAVDNSYVAIKNDLKRRDR